MKLGPEAKENEVTVPRDAATVLLLREAPRGFEVFMVKRSGLSDVLGEAHVFPGGKIDAADSAPAALARVHGLDSLDVAALGEDLPRERAAGMFVAAARETFEEAGVLLAHDVPADLKAARDRVNAKEPLADVLASIGVMLDAAAMVPWVRWVTPPFVVRRFDARFFLAVAPPEQAAVHDDYEATHSEWLDPHEAVERWAAGGIKLAPPTYMSLAHLALFDSLGAVMADARSRRPPIVQPRAFEDGGVRCLAFPGDALHPVAERAIPGPTRLKWDGEKFVPF